MSENFDPYHSWLGIPPEDQPPHHYRLLGITVFEDNAEVISNAADQRMVFLRTFQAGKNATFSQQLLNKVSAAQLCLLDAAKKAAYDASLRQLLATPAASGEAAALDSSLADFITQSDRQTATRSALNRRSRWSSLVTVLGSVAALAALGFGIWAMCRSATPTSSPQTEVAKTTHELATPKAPVEATKTANTPLPPTPNKPGITASSSATVAAPKSPKEAAPAAKKGTDELALSVPAAKPAPAITGKTRLPVPSADVQQTIGQDVEKTLDKARIEKRLGEVDPALVAAGLSGDAPSSFGRAPTHLAHGKSLEAHTKFVNWHSPEKGVNLLSTDQGLCFVTALSGSFLLGTDMVSVKMGANGMWSLSGQSKQQGVAATAASVQLPERVLVQAQPLTWHEKDGSLKLLSANEGVCALAGLKGSFCEADDRLEIALGTDSCWYLTGHCHKGSFDVTVLNIRFAMPDSIQWDTKEYNWTTRMPPLHMIRERDGFCVLTGLRGGLHGPNESIGLYIGTDRAWHLVGRSAKRPMGAKAMSVRFFQK